MSTVTDAIKTVRQPEYTGENRCLPCTAVNVGIAAVLGGAIAAAISVPVGAAAFALCAGVIYLRGYLVPGTPELTKRYLPERVHRLFGTHVEESAVPAEREDEGEDIEGMLRDTGVVTDCPDEDDLCLTRAFREAWYERLEEVREDGRQLERMAARIGVPADDLSIEDGDGGPFTITYEGDRIGMWTSEAAFLADLAAAPLLDEYSPEWQEFDPMEQGQVLTALRSFLETCPTCEGSITGNEETFETCCTTGTRMAVECEDCGAVVFDGRVADGAT